MESLMPIILAVMSLFKQWILARRDTLRIAGLLLNILHIDHQQRCTISVPLKPSENTLLVSSRSFKTSNLAFFLVIDKFQFETINPSPS